MASKNKLKIGVNARFLTQKYTGIGRHTIYLFAEMAAHFRDIELIMAVPVSPDEEIREIFRYLENVKIVVIPEKKLLVKLHSGLSKSYWENIQLSNFFAEEKVDIIHLPYPALTVKKGQTKLVTTIHDAIPWLVEEYKKNSFLGRLYNKLALKMAGKADQLITVSRASKEEISRLGAIQPNQIKAIYNACNYSKANLNKIQDHNEILKKYGVSLDSPYLFYLGGYDKRKNVQRLVNIFINQIASEMKIQLVLGGAKVLQNKLFEDIENVKTSILGNKRVVLTGFIEERDLPCLYSSSMAFISLSKYEGFNLNILEAMSLKTPVIASDIPVHREIAGPGVSLLDLNQSDAEIGQAIVNLLENKNHYNRWREQADKFISPFSWRKSAEELHRIYFNLIKQVK